MPDVGRYGQPGEQGMYIESNHQGPRRHADCQIVIGGMQDVTARLAPYLISVQVIDSGEGGHDECHIELDDRNAELQIPPDGVMCDVYLGWKGEGPRLPDLGRESAAGGQGALDTPGPALNELKWGGPGLDLVFTGTVSEVESGFGRRGGGRRMWITATSGNVKGMAKQVAQGSVGEGKQDDSASESGSGGGASAGGAGGGGAGGGSGKIPLHEAMTKVFGFAGMTVKLSPEMKKIERDFWHWNDSPQNFGKRIAAENGGIFKIAGDVATIVGKGEGVNADGVPMPTVEARWGVNLIGWRIKPYSGRAQWGEASSRFFNINNAVHETVKGAISGGTPFGGTEAIAAGIHQVADKAVGEQQNKGSEQDSKASRGRGWVLINGEPNAKGGGHVYIRDARPGVDGTYLITEAEHNYTRGVGYTTRMNVMYPVPAPNGYGWNRDPGKGNLEPAKPQSTDPLAPNYVPAPPISGDQTYTAEELERMRRYEMEKRIQQGAPGGPDLPISDAQPTPPAAPSPPISAEQTFTDTELNAIRLNEILKQQQEAIRAVPPPAPPAPPISR